MDEKIKTVGGTHMDFARKCIAEFFGTTMFVLIGCLGISMYASTLDALGLCLIFAFVFIAMYFVIGRVSGCHLNPAVSLGMAITGRISWKEFAGYAVSQLVGGFAACGLIALFNSLFGVTGYSANAVYVDTYKSVSYTHLDVYKRQCLLGSIPKTPSESSISPTDLPAISNTETLGIVFPPSLTRSSRCRG